MPRLSSNLLPTSTVATTVNADALVVGTIYRILTVGTTDFTLVGAASNTVGEVFTAIANGTGSGTVTIELEGDKYKGDGFYGYSDGLHTIAHYLLAFEGTLEVQAALTADPVDADWVTLDTRFGDFATPLTENATYNFTGNFVWVRAVASNFQAGTILKIQLNH